MRFHFFCLLLLLMDTDHKNQPVANVDLHAYAGKWYVIGFIPTSFDRRWNYTTESYALNKKGGYNIFTTYRKNGKTKTVRSKAFIDAASGNAKWKVQFVWPFRADYWVIEHDDAYTYTVVGHPKHHFLYIMSRQPRMSDSLYNAISARCSTKGYDISRLRKQQQQ